MKTIDEVIKIYEHGISEVEAYDAVEDALHYLKEYREYLSEEKKKIKQAYEQGYAQAKNDDEVSRRWEESYRQSQMPWNQKYCEMGG